MSIYKNLQPLDFNQIQTYELASRPSKVTVKDFAEPVDSNDSLQAFLARLPNILAVRSIRKIAAQINRAVALQKPVIWGIGGHVIKTGLAPVIIDLMEKGYVSAIASNGSVLVHDTEIALAGFTSEDVDASLGSGDFGAARETGELLNAAAKNAMTENIGLGEAMGARLSIAQPNFADQSVLLQAYKNKIPLTAHLAIGTDIGHFHPSCDGAALGAATHTDFKLFCALVKQLNGGGVYLNIGSSVILPEIFLKAVTVVRNLNFPLTDLTTANFDFIQSYRPNTNVVRRPTAGQAGRGFSITGHHELMIPLLAAHILCSS